MSFFFCKKFQSSRSRGCWENRISFYKGLKKEFFCSISPFSTQRTRVYAGYAVPGTEVWYIWVLKPRGEARRPSTDHLALDLSQLVIAASLTTHSVAHYICSLAPLTLIICFAPRASSIHRLTHSLCSFTLLGGFPNFPVVLYLRAGGQWSQRFYCCSKQKWLSKLWNMKYPWKQ